MSTFDGLTDEEWDQADRLSLALEHGEVRGMTPSTAGRRAKVDTVTARRLLDFLVARQMAHTAGNGAWTRYYPGRGR